LKIPELLDDIVVPDYCAFGQQEEEKELQQQKSRGREEPAEDEDLTMNVFIGPRGTGSELLIFWGKTFLFIIIFKFI
jgi:hypothetical protein